MHERLIGGGADSDYDVLPVPIVEFAKGMFPWKLNPQGAASCPPLADPAALSGRPGHPIVGGAVVFQVRLHWSASASRAPRSVYNGVNISQSIQL